jgi:hypothetical protein
MIPEWRPRKHLVCEQSQHHLIQDPEISANRSKIFLIVLKIDLYGDSANLYLAFVLIVKERRWEDNIKIDLQEEGWKHGLQWWGSE